jgi:hypothetical protein
MFFEKSSNLWSNSQVVLLFDMKNFQKIVEVARKMMLENLVPLNVYFLINLKGESFDLGQ